MQGHGGRGIGRRQGEGGGEMASSYECNLQMCIILE